MDLNGAHLLKCHHHDIKVESFAELNGGHLLKCLKQLSLYTYKLFEHVLITDQKQSSSTYVHKNSMVTRYNYTTYL